MCRTTMTGRGLWAHLQSGELHELLTSQQTPSQLLQFIAAKLSARCFDQSIEICLNSKLLWPGSLASVQSNVDLGATHLSSRFDG